MRTSKIAAIVAAAALLVIGAAFTAFAANTGWVEENGTWKYQKNGEYVCNDWAKSGSDYYYLDENGELGSEQFVDGTNGYLYYCLADGKMAKNQWISKENTDDDSNYDSVIWYYFQNSGKAYAAKDNKTSFKTINGKKYAFDGDGKMLWGWVGKDANMYNTSDSDDWKNATYYCGEETDGAQTTGWKQLTVYDSSQTDVDNTYWFYFGSNGARTQGTDSAPIKTSTINGKKYSFNTYGAMLTEWSYATATGSVNEVSPSTVNQSKYYLTEGALVRKGWQKAVPSEDIDADAYNSDTAYWFYGQSDGTVVANQFKSINSKKYAFNDKGEMLYGIVLANPEEGTPYCTSDELTSITPIKEAIKNGYGVYFFSTSDEDGSMKTGSQTITIDGDSYKFYFSTKNGSKGLGWTGKQGNSYYYGGLKISADDSVAAYQFFPLTNGAVMTFDALTGIKSGDVIDATEYALISTTGSIITSGTRKDGNGLVYKYDSASKKWNVSTES